MRVVQQLKQTESDIKALAGTPINPDLLINDFRDYSKAVVMKPWGYEYLIYQNEYTAVWILHIRKDERTSLHCHPCKTTSITVLSGIALCSTLAMQVVRNPGEVVVVGEGVFHQTASASNDGVFVMEIETPVNKRDLVRMKDDYGREKLGYESIEHMSFSLNNYNYISLITPHIYYNIRKRFGLGGIEIGKCSDIEEFNLLLMSSGWDTISIIKGLCVCKKNNSTLRIGDVLSFEEAGQIEPSDIPEEIEYLVVRSKDTTVRMSDFIVSCIRQMGGRDVFFVAETTNAHLIDALGRNMDINCIPMQTAHAAAYAAEGYSKITGNPGILCIGTGASCLSALPGVADAWIDSSSLFVISAQSRLSGMGKPGEGSLRQLSNKEIDIVSVVRPITKHAVVLSDPLEVKAEIEKAFNQSCSNRHGPVWIDIPIDILGMTVEEWKISKNIANSVYLEKPLLEDNKMQEVLNLIKQAKRPVLLVGNGVRLSGAQGEFLELATRLGMPVMTSRGGVDLVAEDFELFFGRPGTYGQRAANLIIQNADLLLSIGARLSLPLVGRNYKAFARDAKKIVVDIDPAELDKLTLHVDLPVVADAKDFIYALLDANPEKIDGPWQSWLNWCYIRRKIFPSSYDYASLDVKGFNPYRLIEVLSTILDEQDIIVVDGGAPLDYMMQSFKVKRGQRIVCAPGLEQEGFAVHAALGAYMGSRPKRILCLCERKGLQQSIEELRLIVKENLPVKIFVIHSEDPANMARVQKDYFGGRCVGMNGEGIVCSFQIAALGKAYEIITDTINNDANMENKLLSILEANGPSICEILLPSGLEMIPRIIHTVTSDGKWTSSPLEDMYPFLDRQKLKENMLIDIL